MTEEYAELNRTELLQVYINKCQEANVEPHHHMVNYLDVPEQEERQEEEALEIIIQGNLKENFSSRVTDLDLVCICSAFDQFAVYIEDIDLRYNEITDEGAQALADLISKSPRLLGLNLQGNKIKSEGAQYLAEALKEC